MGLGESQYRKKTIRRGQKEETQLFWTYHEKTEPVSRERNYTRNGSGSTKEREAKDQVDRGHRTLDGTVNRGSNTPGPESTRMEKTRS